MACRSFPLLAAFVFLLLADPCRAQQRGGHAGGPGPGSGFAGGHPFPTRSYGPFPGNCGYGYSSFYSNGLSRYGPPVPTYGPVPGFFGGSDQRMFDGYYPGVGVAIVVVKPLAPPPALYPLPPPPPPLLPAPLAPDPSSPREEAPAPRRIGRSTMDPVQVEVRVPETAEVSFDGQLTRQTGTSRVFQSPPLKSGMTYEYGIRGQWREDGRDIVQTRTISVQAGQRVVIDLRQPETTFLTNRK